MTSCQNAWQVVLLPFHFTSRLSWGLVKIPLDCFQNPKESSVLVIISWKNSKRVKGEVGWCVHDSGRLNMCPLNHYTWFNLYWVGNSKVCWFTAIYCKVWTLMWLTTHYCLLLFSTQTGGWHRKGQVWSFGENVFNAHWNKRHQKRKKHNLSDHGKLFWVVK